MAKYFQGTFVPKHPEKYVGDTSNIVFRSSWERKAMIFFDETPNILKWASEEMIVPYISPLDMKPHRYFPDFVIMVKNRAGEIKRIMVEVKPAAQCVPPKATKKTRKMITETQTYMVNQAKWRAATEYCKNNNMEFQILDEYSLGIKK